MLENIGTAIYLLYAVGIAAVCVCVFLAPLFIWRHAARVRRNTEAIANEIAMLRSIVGKCFKQSTENQVVMSEQLEAIRSLLTPDDSGEDA